MTTSILTIGDELLIGQVVNTNASWLGEKTTALGHVVENMSTVGDDLSAIRREIERLAQQHELLFICGGLGPTEDDRTREAICDLLQCEMHMDADQLARIEQRFAERNIEMNQRSRNQALIPAACSPLANDYGSAPGLKFSYVGATIFVLPGVPSELKGICTEQIFPQLASAADELETKTFLIFGPTESALADMLADVNPLLDEHLALAYLPSFGGIRLRLMRKGKHEAVKDRFERVLDIICDRAGEYIVGGSDLPFAAFLGQLLLEKGQTLATAESCTGGLIGELITDIPGSSAYYLGGVVSYANEVKQKQLGVPQELLEAHGAVSREVAIAMAAGCREKIGSDLAVSVTGIAGPDGGSAEKPVGTVWISVASESGVQATKFHLGSERAIVRQRAAYLAMNAVRLELLKNEQELPG